MIRFCPDCGHREHEEGRCLECWTVGGRPRCRFDIDAQSREEEERLRRIVAGRPEVAR